jgi:hypothetical protein
VQFPNKEGFFAAIRHETGPRPFPLGSKHKHYDGFNLNDIPDKCYLDECFGEGTIGFNSMKGRTHGGKTDLWYYALAVKKKDPEEFAKEHNLILEKPPRYCPFCGQ